MTMTFAPGCALTLERPALAGKIFQLLNQHINSCTRLDTCCRNAPQLEDGTTIINVCAGCDKRYRENYASCTTISLWEVIDKTEFWDFPDYNGMQMSILDPCPVRSEARVHNAVRSLLTKMNIEIVEAKNIRDKSICCGDTMWGKVGTDRVLKKMKQRADQMPAENVVVYCVSCVKSIANGGKTPRHLIDLLFGEPTTVGSCDPDVWHGELEAYVADH